MFPSHSTLANSTAEAVGYAPDGPPLGPDGAPQGGGHLDVIRTTQHVNVQLDPVPRIEVRRPWFDIRWILRDWNGMGSLDSFDHATARIPAVRADNNRNSTERGLPFEVAPVLARGDLHQWDEGSEVAAKGAVWW